jgi:hypothetical protein
MPQKDLLMPWRNVLDNAILGMEIQGVPLHEARRRALDFFDLFGLKGFERAYPSVLSGGMRQRAAFLRTVLTGGDVMLLDEPFGALDALTRSNMQEWLLHLWGLEDGPARNFVVSCLSDFTIHCFRQPLDAARYAAASLPRTYIASVKADYPGRVVFAPFAERAWREGWTCHELPTGHDSQVEMPQSLADLLDGVRGFPDLEP